MIIAVDFDGVLVADAFPGIGAPDIRMISVVRRLCLHPLCTVILWTSRVNDRLQDAVDYCTKWGLKFTSVNAGSPDNLAAYGTDPRKIYADLYIDDHACGYNRNKAVELLEFLADRSEINEQR